MARRARIMGKAKLSVWTVEGVLFASPRVHELVKGNKDVRIVGIRLPNANMVKGSLAVCHAKAQNVVNMAS